jgi:DNA polymerase III alpha subunit
VGELAPLQYTNKGIIVTQYEKDAAEALGLIKIDLLGNRALSTVNEAVKSINAQRIASGDEKLDIDKIDQSDEKTSKMLTAGRSMGIFQCESPGMKQMLTGLKIRDQKDIMIALSLIRPGPASGGMKREFIERHRNKKPFKYLHPSLEKILADTYGLLLFQEDVMKIAVRIAGYTLAEANEFRTDVSKKVSGVKLQQQYNDFVYNKAANAGIDRDTAELIWEQVLKFAAYSYCKAHATVYANIAWQTAFLKAHYPVEFYVSLLNNHHGMYPLRTYVWDAIRSGVRVLGPHVNRSGPEWQKEGKAIRAGLGIVGRLSYSTIAEIVEQRSKRPFEDVDDLRSRVRFHKPELQNLIHIGACDGLGQSRPSMLMSLHRNVKEQGQLFLFDMYRPAGVKLPDYDRFARLKAELDVTGIPLTIHPATMIRIKHTQASDLTKKVGMEVVLAGFVATARTARAENGDVIGFVTIEDESGMAEVTFFADQIQNYYKICSTPGPVWVKGRVSEHLSSFAIDCISCGSLKIPA